MIVFSNKIPTEEKMNGKCTLSEALTAPNSIKADHNGSAV
jgi:hypothetical protein